MISIYLISLITLLLILYGIVEFFIHQKRVAKIPIRIHINGTRGKSSVTRLIGAGLRAGGIKAITKVTGTFPRLILPDGSETKIFRKEKANILEQLNIIKFCAQSNVDALLIECMALQPLFQKITETQMVHATLGVITNIRLDHLDVMGPGIKDVANAIGNTIPKNELLFSSEDKHYKYLSKLCKKKNTTLHRSVVSTVSDKDMEDFNYLEHKINVALALDICAHFNIDRAKALKEMKKMMPDEGALVKNRIIEADKRIDFYNAFAANDPESSRIIWNSIVANTNKNELKIILLTVRHDRQSRALQLIELISTQLLFDFVVLIGETTNLIEDQALKLQVPKNKIINKYWNTPQMVFQELIELSQKETTIIGLGNMGAMGAEVSQIFKKESAKR